MHVLLLHGLPGDAADWGPVVERLTGAGFEPIVPDRPGWGRSGERGRDLDGNVSAALAALDGAGAGAAAVVGHSWGTLVALALAERHSDRVAGLGLVSPFGPGSQSRAGKLFASPRTGPPLIATHLTISANALRAPLLGPLIGRRFNLPADVRAQRAEHWRSGQAREAFLLERRAVRERLDGLLRSAPAVATPTRILVGSRDHTTGVEPARRLAVLIPRARFDELPRAGHFLPLTHPDAVADAVVGLFALDSQPSVEELEIPDTR